MMLVISELTAWLWVAGVRIGVLFLIALLASRWMGDRAIRSQVLLWRTCLVMIGVVACLPVRASADRALALPPLPEPSVTAPLLADVDPVPAEPAPSAARAFVPAPAQAQPAWPRVIAFVYVAGLSAGWLYVLAGYGALWFRLRQSRNLNGADWDAELARSRRALAIAGRVRLATTPWRAAPVLVGWAFPTVLLPEACGAWDGPRRRAVLMHELAHLAHRDLVFSALGALLRTVFWFHPAVHVATRELLRAQELRCDRAAVASGLDPLAYARSLLALARTNVRGVEGSLVSPFASAPTLEERVRMLLLAKSAEPARKGLGSVSSCAPILVVALAGLTSAWGVGLSKETPIPNARSSPLDGGLMLEVPVGAERVVLDLSADVRIVPTDGPPRLRLVGERVESLRDRMNIGLVDTNWEVRDPMRAANAGVVVELYAPPTLAVVCRVHEGSVSASAVLPVLEVLVSRGTIDYRVLGDVIGSTTLHTANGRIFVEVGRLDGEMSAAVSLGSVDVELREMGSTGDLSLSAGRGDVTLRLPDPEAVAFDADASRGSLTLPDIEPSVPARLRCSVNVGLGKARVFDSHRAR